MKPRTRATLNLLVLTIGSAFSFACAAMPARADDARPRVIDDREIRGQFEKQLGGVKDDGGTPGHDALQKQLAERDGVALDVELPGFAGEGELSTAEIYERRLQSVLCFGHIYKCDKCSKWHGNLAGGFVITEDGIAVTNYHVMENGQARAFGAMTADGKVYYVEEVLASSKDDDLAIVKLAGEGFTAAPVMPGAPVGSKVVAISHPDSRFYSVSEGIIARYYQQPMRGGEGAARFAITADFAKGSSGCPVFSSNGAVAGVVSSTNSIYYERKKDGTQTNLQMVIKSCIPSSAILRLIRKPSPEEAPTPESSS